MLRNVKIVVNFVVIILVLIGISPLQSAPAWPVYLGESITYSSPLIADLDKDGVDEVLIGTTEGTLYALRENGSIYWSYETQGEVVSSPAGADIDRDGYLEIIFYSKDGYIYVLNHDGTPLGGEGYEWPYYLGTTTRATTKSIALGDLDNDLFLEIVAGSGDGLDNRLVALDHTGGVLWDVEMGDINGHLYNTPAIGDVNGDGYADVVISYGDGLGGPPSQTGYIAVFDGLDGTRFINYQIGTGGFSASPALGDINNDGYLEIIGVTDQGNISLTAWIFALDHSGEEIWSIPITDDSIDYVMVASPALGNIDDDENLEILIPLSRMRAYDDNGNKLWRNSDEQTGFSSPALLDINEDDRVETFVGSFSYIDQLDALSGYSQQGDELDGFPYLGETQTGVYSSPSLGDIDKDGHLDIVIGMPDGYLYRWDTDFPYSGGKAIWMTFHSDEKRSGVYGSPRLNQLEDITTNVGEEISFAVVAQDIDDREADLSYFAEDIPEGASFERRLNNRINEEDGKNKLIEETMSLGTTPHHPEPVLPPYRFTWTPAPKQVGEYLVTFIVKDPKGGYDSKTVKIEVIPDEQSVTEKELAGIQEEQSSASVALSFSLKQSIPNPFARSEGTAIVYSIPERANVTLSVYNSVGQRIKTLVSSTQERGIYRVVWDGRSDYGERVAEGIYFIRMKAGSFKATRKMSILR